jgi:hypothetical protein
MDATTVALLQPLEEALVSAAAAGVLAGAGAITYWAQKHFAFARTAAARSIEANANAVLQSATQNAAGDIVKGIKDGSIDLNNAAGIRSAAEAAARTVALKVPDAIDTLQPGLTTLADMVVQKAHLAMAPTIVSGLVSAGFQAAARPAEGMAQDAVDRLVSLGLGNPATGVLATPR